MVFLIILFGVLYWYQSSSPLLITQKQYIPVHPLEKSAMDQIGVVTEYDLSNGYYAGGDPPAHTGVCSDVVIRALKNQGYDLQEKIFEDIKNFPDLYPDTPDRNINHRRVKNMKIFFDRYFFSLPVEVNDSTLDNWQAGDIVTYKQIPGRLWHIGIVSGQTDKNGIPLLIDNHGYGTNIRIRITDWQSEISGHYRFFP